MVAQHQNNEENDSLTPCGHRVPVMTFGDITSCTEENTIEYGPVLSSTWTVHCHIWQYVVQIRQYTGPYSP